MTKPTLGHIVRFVADYVTIPEGCRGKIINQRSTHMGNQILTVRLFDMAHTTVEVPLATNVLEVVDTNVHEGEE